MENSFDTDDFESFLKDTIDSFKMYPSKKVWYGLYNDLHPGRRWPSLAVSLLLICAILFIGISNNNSINNTSKYYVTEKIKNQTKNNSTIISDLTTNKKAVLQKLDLTLNNNTVLVNKGPQQNKISLLNLSNPVPSATLEINSSAEEVKVSEVVVNTTIKKVEPVYNVEIPTSFELVPFSGDNTADRSEQLSQNINYPKRIIAQTKPLAADNALSTVKVEDKIWIDDYAFYNRHAVSKWKSNSALQFYLTPSQGFRELYKNNELAIAPTLANNGLVVANTINTLTLKDKITQYSALNIEAGGAFLYNLSKKFRFKTGLQLNYTNYNVDANKLEHPNQTYLLLNNTNTGAAILVSRTSFYANSTSDENKRKLKNNSLQLSVPIGVDYKLAGKNNLKWYAGSSIQPTFITGGHLYALSADEKNYVDDISLLRKWNFNASVETFLSFKTINGTIISAGPQLRYQLLSTYDKRFTYTEKLYNLGVKFGIIKKF
ncbi:MAG: outer membrane beta-barrel protein [Ferruginibacter sp.]